MNITPSNQQAAALRAISGWYKSGSTPFFYLAGYAGSGKSSLIRLAVDQCGLDPDDPTNALYGSFSGKAAMVMTRKGVPAQTIHQLIYTLIEKDNGELIFGINPDSELSFTKLLVLDECSMVSDKIANDLLRFGVKILVIGDPGQLDPVRGTGYFTNGTPDYFLSEIHRQALESAIIRLSQDVRNGLEIPFGDFGDVRKLYFEDLSDGELLGSDQIITGKHVTRHMLNSYMLNLEGFPAGYPTQPGMKVMCLRNYPRMYLLNGLIGRTTDVVDYDHFHKDERHLLQSVYIEDGLRNDPYQIANLRMNLGAFEDNWNPRNEKQIKFDDDLVEKSVQAAHRHDDPSITQYLWDYAYAITVHKAQGSQWDNPILFDDGMFNWIPEARKKWLYTAITRAAKTLTIVE